MLKALFSLLEAARTTNSTLSTAISPFIRPPKTKAEEKRRREGVVSRSASCFARKEEPRDPGEEEEEEEEVTERTTFLFFCRSFAVTSDEKPKVSGGSTKGRQ